MKNAKSPPNNTGVKFPYKTFDKKIQRKHIDGNKGTRIVRQIVNIF